MFKKLILSVMIILVVLSINSARSEDLLWQKDIFTTYTLEFSPNENAVAYGYKGGIYFFDNQTGEQIRFLPLDDENEVIQVICFSRDGKYLVAGTARTIYIKPKLYVWDAITFEKIIVKVLDNYPDFSPYKIDFSSDNSLFAIATGRGGLRIYDTVNWEEIMFWNEFPVVSENGKHANVTNVSFSKDGKVVAISSSQINQVIIFDIKSKQTLKTYYNAANAIFSPTRNEILLKKMFKEGASYYTEGLELYDLNTNIEPIFIYLSEEHYDKYAEFTTFSFSPDGNYIAISAVKGGHDNFQILNRNSLKKIFSKNYGKGGSSFPRIDKSNHYFACVDLCLNTENSICLTIYEVSNYLEVFEDNNTKFEIYPNPSENILNIQYYLDMHSEVKLLITDIKGNIIDTIINENQETGNYNIDFRTDKLPSGTYFIILTCNGQKTTKQIQVVK